MGGPLEHLPRGSRRAAACLAALTLGLTAACGSSGSTPRPAPHTSSGPRPAPDTSSGSSSSDTCQAKKNLQAQLARLKHVDLNDPAGARRLTHNAQFAWQQYQAHLGDAAAAGVTQVQQGMRDLKFAMQPASKAA